ncbi:hypothetical protein [Pseudomonas moraviensis]|uniref:hypothetical protein n=1 Tax=Pseudomonas moraviensis TaxID=321662 RepID=UPI00080E5542|nr:hypothetical protein [Pseudomonas moraviensis]
MDAMKIDTRTPSEQSAMYTFRLSEKFVAFILATLLMFMAQLYINPQTFLGDAYNYWDLSSKVWDFSFPKSLRGYFYPLLLSPARIFFDAYPATGYLAVHLIQALAFSYSLCISLPYVFSKVIGGKITLPRRLMVPALVAIFFPPLIAYTLSDLPAFCLIIGALALILKASEQKSVATAIVLMIVAGVLAYGAYNTRTIYLFTLIALLPAIPLLALKNQCLRKKMLLLAFFVIGSAIAAIPQSLINKKHLDSATPLVVASVNDASLFASQLKWGITLQRYETGHDTETGAIFRIFYLDPIGVRLTEELKFKGTVPTLPWYFQLLLSEPVSFLKIYTKHFVNGLDVRDYDTYTKVRSKENDVRSATSIATALFGLICLFLLVIRKSDKPAQGLYRIGWLAVIVLPVFAILPGAIETRFFLPLHVMAYCAIAFGVSKQCARATSAKVLIPLGILFVVAVPIAFMIAKAAISNPVFQLN